MKMMDVILQGDALAMLKSLPSGIAHTCVTSPPTDYYSLRDYGVPGQLGLEPTIGEYVAKLVEVFREVRRVLRPDATLWVNLGDSYANDGKRATRPVASVLRGCMARRRSGGGNAIQA